MPDEASREPGTLYDRANVDAAIAEFRRLDLNQVEALLASAELFHAYLKQFRTGSKQLRQEAGDETIGAFARFELNDLIADLQDSIAPTVRTYNALLRDPEDDAAPGG